MVDFEIVSGFRPIGATAVPASKAIDVVWFTEDIAIKLPDTKFLATIVVDFYYTASGVVEYTLDGQTTWIPMNNGQTITGGQSRFIDVVKDAQVNFRSKAAGNLHRCIVSSVP